MPTGGPPPDDDDPEAEWSAPNTGDTVVDLEPTDLVEFGQDDDVTPSHPGYTLPGYELGRRDERAAFLAAWDGMAAVERHRGFALAMHVVRDHMLDDGAAPEIADAIIAALAKRAGVKLG